MRASASSDALSPACSALPRASVAIAGVLRLDAERRDYLLIRGGYRKNERTFPCMVPSVIASLLASAARVSESHAAGEVYVRCARDPIAAGSSYDPNRCALQERR